MAGIENTIVISNGERLSESSADDISRMQTLSNDVSRINHTGDPEGVVSANPSSLSHDPVSGTVYVKETGTGNTGWSALATMAGSGSSIYNVFTSSTTWSKNAATKFCICMLWSGGNGGGSGRKSATNDAYGGGGGTSGVWLTDIIPATAFASSETITIGDGGAGGAAQTSADTNGLVGLAAGASSIGTILATGVPNFAVGPNGPMGAGGTNALVEQDGLPAIGVMGSGIPFPDGICTGGNGNNAVGFTPTTQYQTDYGTPGGGGGGLVNGLTPGNGGTGGPVYNISSTVQYAAGGTAGGGGASGGNGGNGSVSGSGYPRGGTGGGGGGAGIAGNGGNGGNGAVPGGGGGGGGATAIGTQSGAGGAGGKGMIIIIEVI